MTGKNCGLTIGRLACQAQVNVETIRYYELCGLIEQPPRPQSGFRHYPPETAARLRFIRRAQELGFSLEEIGELLSLRVENKWQLHTAVMHRATFSSSAVARPPLPRP